MSIRRLLVLAGLLSVSAPVVFSEARCPGSASSLPLRLVQGTLFILPVEVNGTGPYEFLLDTGAQVNSIDETLAASLHLSSTRTVGVTGAGTYSRTSLVEPDLKAGSAGVVHSPTVIVPSAQLRAIGLDIHGILGGSFLEQFEFLLENDKHILCLDQSGSLAVAIKGKRIALTESRSNPSSSVSKPLVVSARLSGVKRSTLLALDSGTNVPFLFLSDPHALIAGAASTQILKRVVNGVEQAFSVTQPQDIHIEHTLLRGVPFVEPINWIGGSGANLQVDGAIPTIAFRRMFVSFSKGYVILDPWTDSSRTLVESSHAFTDRSADPSQMVGQYQPPPLDPSTSVSRGRR